MAKSDRATRQESRDVLTVEGLTKVYPDGTLAVDDVDFSVGAGDFCVIIGPSGCGKSTTLHSLVGKIPPTEGTVTLDGRDITDVPTYRRDIGLVFQDFQLFPHLSVEENVRYGLERMSLPREEADGRVESVTEMMQLDGMLDRDPTELSAGQQQRVALARSLVLEPKLLLLDEPLGDMDYKLQKRMERELLRIHREFDTTFVYVTHDQTQAMRLADQIIVMNGGKIEHSGTVGEVYDRPRTAFTAAFVGDSNLFSGAVTGLEREGAVAVLDTDFGEFRASTANLSSDPEAVVGEDVVFAVRPQFVDVDGDGDGTGDNRLACDVDDVIYRSGEGTQFVLTARSESGASKEVQAKTERRVELDADAVTVGWDAADAILLERTSVTGQVDLQQDILGE